MEKYKVAVKNPKTGCFDMVEHSLLYDNVTELLRGVPDMEVSITRELGIFFQDILKYTENYCLWDDSIKIFLLE